MALGNNPKQNEVVKAVKDLESGKQNALPTTTTAGQVLKSTSTAGTLEWGSIPSGTPTDVQVNGTSITSGGVANIVTNTAYNASSNKVATMSDVPTKDSDLTNDRYVRYDTNAQGLTSTQKSNARTNIGASDIIADDVVSTTDVTPLANYYTKSQIDTKLAISIGNSATASQYVANGTCVYNTYGDLVIVYLTDILVGSTTPDNAALLFSGLPVPRGTNILFMLTPFTNESGIRCTLNASGEIKTHWSKNSLFGSSGNHCYAMLTYIKGV